MSAALLLARFADMEAVVRLVTASHEEEGITRGEDTRRAALQPLLEGSPYGAVYLIGPTRAPIGYIAITFSWSLEFGGLDGMIDEFFLRPAVRGRGIATEVLMTLPNQLARAGLRAIHLEVDLGNSTARRLYERTGFKARDNYALMSKVL
ncbi:MAG: GNAT family N-acetyltransferase, partial [Arenibacterium sp.]